mgnify:FL=1
MNYSKRATRKVYAVISVIIVVLLVFTAISAASVDTDSDIYVKFQDRMSMDWDYDDSIYLRKAVMLKGQSKSLYEKADIIVVTLNRVLSTKYPKDIKSVVEQIAEEEETSLDEIEPDSDSAEALRIVKHERYDNTKGRLEYE